MLRIGAVSYLNTKPLIHGLSERLRGWGTLSLNLPSRLAADLHAGRLDAALIPSVEYLRNRDRYRIVSDAAIGCRGPVWSVRLMSHVPARRIRTLALDEGSRTSAAMLRVLLWEIHGLRPDTVALPMETLPERCGADAALVIGDRAMHPPPRTYREIWDLGDRWVRHTGLPFVFATWVTRRDTDPPVVDRLAETLGASRDAGLNALPEIADRYAACHGLTFDDLHRYFTDNLHFRLGRPEHDGLNSFAARVQTLDRQPELIETPS